MKISEGKVRKFTVFYSQPFRRGLAEQNKGEVVHALKVASELIAVLNWMCLTGRLFGHSERDIDKLPEGLRTMHKYFLGGWKEAEDLRECVLRSTRVECRYLVMDGGIQIEVGFFVKAKDQLGTLYVTISAKGQIGTRGLAHPRSLSAS